MRNSKSITVMSIFFIMITISCNKDSDNLLNNEINRTSTLSFGVVLNNMIDSNDQNRQALENIPKCSENIPAYLEVVIRGNTNVGTMKEPMILKVAANSAQLQNKGESTYFTLESVDLELEPGNYTLEYFSVYDGDPKDADSEMIWVAPSEEDDFANFVDAAIPINFELKAGIKKNLDVGVVCYDKSLANIQEDLFPNNEVFQIQSTRAIDFCLFGSFCDEVGRSHLAKYMVSGWMYSGDAENPKGDIIFLNRENKIIITDYEDSSEKSSEPLCVQLPDHSGQDYYYMEISIMPFDYECEEKIIRKGIITDSQVKSLYKDNHRISYFHFREGNCNMDDTPVIFQKL